MLLAVAFAILFQCSHADLHKQEATTTRATPYCFDKAKYHVIHSQDKDFPIKDIHVLDGTLPPSGGVISLHSINGTFPDTKIHFGPAQNITKYLTHERNMSTTLAGGKQFHGRAIFIDSPYANLHELQQMLWYKPGTWITQGEIGMVVIGPNPPPLDVAIHGVPLHDNFTTYNEAVWSYADASEGKTDGCKVWYLKNHSHVNAVLSDGSHGLSMLMSATPNPAACNGAKMTADHIETKQSQLYGTYTLKARTPHKVDSADADNGVYAYFTAGYASHGGKWNEMNFGFHPDRDDGGYAVSCEHHDDTGSYHETTVKVDKNVRATFNTYAITVSKTKMVWSFNGMTIHSVDGKWTEPMTTRLIMRTNFRNGDPGVMPDHVFEINEYSFTPTLEVRL